MVIRHLSLTNFRSFKRIELDFPSHLNLLVGENAQGKTSVLEAVNVLSILTSSVAGHDREMVNFLALDEEIPVSRLVAEIEKEGKKHHLEVRLILNNGSNGVRRLRKEVLIDKNKRKLLDAVGFFNSVLFLPQMTRIIEDGPDERRKYIDRTLSQAFPGYVRALSAYQQGIIRRNALLKQLMEQGGARDQLVYWDELIAENGSIIMHTRNFSIKELDEKIHHYQKELTEGVEQIRLSYIPSLLISGAQSKQMGLGFNGSYQELSDIDDIKALFIKKLADLRDEEIRRGVTTIGPHRDDLRFIVNERDLSKYGSRGQIRTTITALKLSEVYWLQAKTGEKPVLLLDETLAELDQKRRRDLLHVLEKNSQSIMTTTDLHLFTPEFVEKSSVWHLKNGSIESL